MSSGHVPNAFIPAAAAAGQIWVVSGAALAGLAVLAGALGAHVLEARLTPRLLQSFEVAVRYQMYHAFAVILVGLLAAQRDGAMLRASGIAFLIGTVLFSGGLYGWILTHWKPLVHVVPLGGVTWIAAWILLGLSQNRQALRPGG